MLPSVSLYVTVTSPLANSYTYVTFCGFSVTLPFSFPSVRVGTRLYTFPSVVVILVGFNASVTVVYSFPVGDCDSTVLGVS